MSKEYINRELLENALEDENKNGNFVFTANWIMEIIDNLPTADVVPKSEVEKLVQDGTRLGQENETLKDNNEHLAVMLEEAKSEVERLQAKKDALIKNYAECMKDYAREIFEEIDNNLQESKDCVSLVRIFKLTKFIAELKKKYTEIEK